MMVLTQSISISMLPLSPQCKVFFPKENIIASHFFIRLMRFWGFQRLLCQEHYYKCTIQFKLILFDSSSVLLSSNLSALYTHARAYFISVDSHHGLFLENSIVAFGQLDFFVILIEQLGSSTYIQHHIYVNTTRELCLFLQANKR